MNSTIKLKLLAVLCALLAMWALYTVPQIVWDAVIPPLSAWLYSWFNALSPQEQHTVSQVAKVIPSVLPFVTLPFVIAMVVVRRRKKSP